MAKCIEGQTGCTGCGACVNICQVKAVTLVEDRAGFYYPAINDNCVDCGLCAERCPAIKPRYLNWSHPTCYAAQASDELRLAGSSSGAVFPVLAERVLKQNGLVCGAAYKADFSGVEHVLVDNIADLQALKGSKYMQSDTRKIYPLLQPFLASGRLCLFSGTPCSVAGLYAALGDNHDNLLTLDLVCHGVAPAKIWRQYLSERFPGEVVLSVNMRDKGKGWGSCMYIKINTDHGEYLASCFEDHYMRMFLNDLALRASCAKCAFNQMPRQADLSIGDFWGLDRFDRKGKLDDGLGVSCITVNNEKGRIFLSESIGDFKLIKKAPMKIVKKGNRNFMESSRPHHNSNFFINDIKSGTFSENVARNIDGHCDVLVLNFWFCDNFGAIITAYALGRLIEEYGLSPQFVNLHYIGDQIYERRAANFISKYFRTVPPCLNNDDLIALNNMADTFVVGSDQVWRSDKQPKYHHAFFLDFAEDSKKKIACSVSFGLGQFDLPEPRGDRLRQLARRFDHVSVREDDGVKICKNTFGIEAEHLLDPVFALDRSEYDRLAGQSKRTDSDFIISYCMWRDEKRQRQYEYIENYLSDKLGKPCIRIKLNDENISVEDWLYLFKESSFILTDSFHGACFSILFNRPFLTLDHAAGGSSRFQSLFRTFDTLGRFFSDPMAVKDLPAIDIHMDYSAINEKITIEKNRFKTWLNTALSSEKGPAKFEPEDSFRILKERVVDLEELCVLLAQRNAITLNYCRYRIMSALTWGKRKKSYQRKRRRYKLIVQRLRILSNRVRLTTQSGI